MTTAIAEPRDMTSRHWREVQFLRALVIDLKLQLAGEAYRPITPERLHEASMCLRELEECNDDSGIR